MSRALAGWGGWIVGAAVVAGLALGLDGYAADLYRKLLLTATLCIGFNFLFGIAGQVAFSHIAFYGIGAYAVVILAFACVFIFLGHRVLLEAATVTHTKQLNARRFFQRDDTHAVGHGLDDLWPFGRRQGSQHRCVNSRLHDFGDQVFAYQERPSRFAHEIRELRS